MRGRARALDGCRDAGGYRFVRGKVGILGGKRKWSDREIERTMRGYRGIEGKGGSGKTRRMENLSSRE